MNALSLIRSLSFFPGYGDLKDEGEQVLAATLIEITKNDEVFAEAIILELRRGTRLPTENEMRELAFNLRDKYLPRETAPACPACGGTGWIIRNIPVDEQEDFLTGARRCACGAKGDPPLPPQKMDRNRWQQWYGKSEPSAKKVIETVKANLAPRRTDRDSARDARRETIRLSLASGRAPHGFIRELFTGFDELRAEFPDLFAEPEASIEPLALSLVKAKQEPEQEPPEQEPGT
jgi:hypothetical protein